MTEYESEKIIVTKKEIHVYNKNGELCSIQRATEYCLTIGMDKNFIFFKKMGSQEIKTIFINKEIHQDFYIARIPMNNDLFVVINCTFSKGERVLIEIISEIDVILDVEEPRKD